MAHYYMLLDKNASDSLSANERQKLDSLRTEADRFMLCKAHAAALLKWRGVIVYMQNNYRAINMCSRCKHQDQSTTSSFSFAVRELSLV